MSRKKPVTRKGKPVPKHVRETQYRLFKEGREWKHSENVKIGDFAYAPRPE